MSPTVLVTQIAHELLTRHLRLATAESCTGGGLAYWLTSIPGSSEWFERGFVTYSNAAKQELLAVPPALLEKYGAVSAETAAAMAEGALHNSKADISVSITGVAGPSGGSAEKPVGTVWFAWSGRMFETRTEMVLFSGDRSAIREQAIQKGLEGLQLLLQHS